MKDKQTRQALAGRPLANAKRRSLFPWIRLPITNLGPLFEALPAEFQLLVADVGSIGGLHRRWHGLGPHLATINFDPLDQRRGTDRERIFPFLLAERDGKATLKITRRGSMSSTLDPDQSFYAPFWDKPADVEIVDRLTVTATSLDSVAAKEGLAPDALKIDVQGGEGAVLAGAVDILAGSVLLAEIECSFAARYEGQQTFDQVAAFMRERGFGLVDVRRLKRYRFKNAFGIRDPSLGRGMRAGRLAFCDAIFIIEPERLWEQLDQAGAVRADLGLKAIVLLLVYGKADLAAAIFERVQTDLPDGTRKAFRSFFQTLSGDGGWRQRLHRLFDRWAQRV